MRGGDRRRDATLDGTTCGVMRAVCEMAAVGDMRYHPRSRRGRARQGAAAMSPVDGAPGARAAGLRVVSHGRGGPWRVPGGSRGGGPLSFTGLLSVRTAWVWCPPGRSLIHWQARGGGWRLVGDPLGSTATPSGCRSVAGATVGVGTAGGAVVGIPAQTKPLSHCARIHWKGFSFHQSDDMMGIARTFHRRGANKAAYPPGPSRHDKPDHKLFWQGGLSLIPNGISVRSLCACARSSSTQSVGKRKRFGGGTHL